MSSLPRPATLIAAAIAAGVATYALTGGSFRLPWDWLNEATTARAGSERFPTGDRDCRDFATWWQAQVFYMRSWPGDPHRLDGDHDLIACESLL